MARRGRIDQLGLRSGLADRVLPALVGAMSFLAALALAGTLSASSLATQWRADTESALTIQVPQPDQPAAGSSDSRASAVLKSLQATPGVADAARMSADDVNRLLAPWLGQDAGSLDLPVPAVITATWTEPGDASILTPALQKIAPGTLLSTGAIWAKRVAALTASLQACAAAVLIIVALIAAAVVSVATRAGLAQRREAVEIIHGLGAQDGDIAGGFAARASILAVTGAAIGTVLALPILVWLATLAAPFGGIAPGSGPNLPPALWIALPLLPVMAALIGWGTAQLTVRGWLRHLA